MKRMINSSSNTEFDREKLEKAIDPTVWNVICDAIEALDPARLADGGKARFYNVVDYQNQDFPEINVDFSRVYRNPAIANAISNLSNVVTSYIVDKMLEG